jgi:hypothetical protein
METHDGFLFPRFQPEIAGHPTVVLIGSSIALAPVVELTGSYAQPMDEPSGTDLGFL